MHPPAGRKCFRTRCEIDAASGGAAFVIVAVQQSSRKRRCRGECGGVTAAMRKFGIQLKRWAGHEQSGNTTQFKRIQVNALID